MGIPCPYPHPIQQTYTVMRADFSLCAISTQVSNSGANIPPPPTHTNLRCIDFLNCAGKSTYGRFMVWLFLTVLWIWLQCVIVVFPDYAHLSFQREI